MLWAFRRRREGLVPELAKNFTWLTAQNYINYCQDRVIEARRQGDVVSIAVYERRVEKLLIYIGNKLTNSLDDTNPGIPSIIFDRRSV